MKLIDSLVTTISLLSTPLSQRLLQSNTFYLMTNRTKLPSARMEGHVRGQYGWINRNVTRQLHFISTSNTSSSCALPKALSSKPFPHHLFLLLNVLDRSVSCFLSKPTIATPRMTRWGVILLSNTEDLIRHFGLFRHSSRSLVSCATVIRDSWYDNTSEPVGQVHRPMEGQVSGQPLGQVEEQETWQHAYISDKCLFTCLGGPNKGIYSVETSSDVWIYSPGGWEDGRSIKKWRFWSSSKEQWNFQWRKGWILICDVSTDQLFPTHISWGQTNALYSLLPPE